MKADELFLCREPYKLNALFLIEDRCCVRNCDAQLMYVRFLTTMISSRSRWTLERLRRNSR